MGNYLFATNATSFQKDSYMYEIKKMVKSDLFIGGGINECYGTIRSCTYCTKILTF